MRKLPAPRAKCHVNGYTTRAQHSKGLMLVRRCPSCLKIDSDMCSIIRRTRSQPNSSPFNQLSRLYLTSGRDFQVGTSFNSCIRLTPLIVPASSGANTASKALQNKKRPSLSKQPVFPFILRVLIENLELPDSCVYFSCVLKHPAIAIRNYFSITNN